MSSNKVTFPLFDIKNPFLPSPNEVQAFLGYPSSARGLLKMMGKYLNITLPISDRSLDNFGTTGISQNLANKVMTQIETKVNNRFAHKDILPSEPFSMLDLGVVWLINDKALQATCPEVYQEFRLDKLFEFINQRCKHYQSLLDFITQSNVKNRSPEGSELFEITKEFYSLVIEHTRLTEQEQNDCLNLFKNKASNLNHQASQNEYQALMFFIYDFYLSLFAVIDILITNKRIRLAKQHNWPLNHPYYDTGYLSGILKCEGKCCFDLYLTYIHQITGLSFYKLAKCIPVDIKYQANSSVSLEQQERDKQAQLESAQRTRLDEWRKGQTKPSFDRICQFLENLGCVDSFDLAIYGIICQAIDRDLPQRSQHEQKMMTEQLYTPEHYNIYYDHYKKQLGF